MHTVSPTPLEDFFSHYTLVHFSKGERILRENELPGGVFFVKKGIVRTYLISEEGNELTVIMQEDKTIFPWRWAITNQENVYNFQAMTDVELLRAPREAFQNFLKSNPDLLYAICGQITDDYAALIYRMQHIVFGNAHAKVAAVVITAAKQFGQNDKMAASVTVEVPLTHQQIADSAGITRETASLEMKKLKDEGLITYHGRILTVLDMEGLRKASFL